jgi:hypothetical protein
MGSRLAALSLFVLGQSVLAALSPGVALVPALVTFLAGSTILVRSYSTVRGERTTASTVSSSTLRSSQSDQFSM